jgi:hypothetical protein
MIGKRRGELIYRQSVWTRMTHCGCGRFALFFLLLSGLQIFNAHPTLYIGDQSGFQFDNAVLSIGAQNTTDGPRGYATVLGTTFDTTGVLGWSGDPSRALAFPSWATLDWVDWFNNCRLLGPIGNIPPAEAEARFYAQSAELAMVA